MSETNKKLGQLLKVERERQSISLEDLSTRLKISESNLISIEEGKASDLPSELYFDLFSRSYCQALGIDHARTLEAIDIELEEKAVAEAPIKNGGKGKSGDNEESPRVDLTSNIKKLGMIFGSIIVLFIGFMLISKFAFNNPASETDAASNPENHANKGQGDELEMQLADYQWGSVQNTYREPIKLRLTAIDSSWATILADGDTAVFRKLRPGRIYNVEAKYRLRISIGIPRAIVVELNGTKVNLVDPDSRRISRVRINQMNLESFINTTAPDSKKKNSEVGSQILPVEVKNSSNSKETG